MVPEKTRAAQDESSEEQRGGKTPVREGRRAQAEGRSPAGAGPGARWRPPDARRFCAVIRCCDSLSEWRLCAWGGSGQESALCMPTRSPICVN